MRHIHRRYLREFFPAMGGYVLAILATTWLLKHHGADFGLGARAALALLPVLPIVLAMRALVRAIRDSDELERQVELESVAISALLVGTGYFALGLLASAQVIVLRGADVALWVWPALMFVYGLAKCWAMRRYR
jgi:hypothetical protein